MPKALKIFGLSMIAGVVGTYAGFRIGYWMGEGFILRGLVDILGATVFAGIFGIAFGVATAVTSGVVAGKQLKG